MSHSTIRAIVFDFGGVIELSEGGHLLKDIAEAIGIPIVDFKGEYFKHNHLSNVENLDWEDMILKVVSVFDGSEETKNKVLAIINEYQSQRKINVELVAMFPKLKQQGFKIAIFSNHTSKLRDKLKGNGILDLVDEVVVSGEIGFQKPHKEAFDCLFEILKVQPHEVVFIDDSPKSLEKAGEIGYIPILFKNNEQLKTDLSNLEIVI